MYLKRLRVENFRALEKLDVEFDTRVSVVIGPNAVGKTTVLEAIRLAKGVLAPRTQNEANQVLQSLGATSPHMPQQLFSASMTTKPSQPLVIKCTYHLEATEIAKLHAISPRLISVLAQQNAGLVFSPPAQLVAFFGSPAGQAALVGSKATIEAEMARIAANGIIELNLTINFQSGQISGEFPAQQLFFSALEGDLPPNSTLFSYFPADRALPPGEQQVQLGTADTASQLESYNSQPQVKYHRLKNAIFNSIIQGTDGRTNLIEQFRLIFDRILRGRALGEIGINQLGMLSIPIKDVESGVEFQIDGLSSGEKGLILTFLLIAQNVAKNGIILLDEPELHLNPAVCRHLLQFFVDEYADKRNIQAIICSHSAEILAGTFERPSCSLFHLRDGKTLAKVRHKDEGEIRDALRRLGSSESEALLYKATVSVEGIHDVEVLQAGFDDLFRRYKLKQRGGRGQVEKDIEELRKAERTGDDIGSHYFIFDFDRKPTSLRDSEHVKLLQLDRYCLENFVLDVDILTDLSRLPEYSDNPKGTPTAMRDVMKSLAMAQLDEHVSRLVFAEMGLQSVGFDMTATKEPEAKAVAAALWRRIDEMSATFKSFSETGFDADFVQKFNEKKKLLEPEWDEKWRELCNGKQLLEDMRRDKHLKGDLLKLKKTVMSRMREAKTETYKSLESTLRTLIGA